MACGPWRPPSAAWLPRPTIARYTLWPTVRPGWLRMGRYAADLGSATGYRSAILSPTFFLAPDGVLLSTKVE